MVNENSIASIQCPKCNNQEFNFTDGVIQCRSCMNRYSIKNDIVDLRIDKSFDTLLDQKTYDDFHNINDQHSIRLYRIYHHLLDEFGADMNGSLLEIACGSGALTMGFVEHSQFDRIHISDISPEFMKQAILRIKEYPHFHKVNAFLFDANTFPLKDNYYDAVLGNSVLHHFAEFENSLEESFRVLKKGGVAVFGEPILDTHSFISMVALQIFEIDKRRQKPLLSSNVSNLLLNISKIAERKRMHLDTDRSKLGHIEDKFQFPVKYMKEVADKIGFSDFDCRTPRKRDDFASVINRGINRIFKQQGQDIKELGAYQFIIDSIGSTLGVAMRDYNNDLFSFFVFKK